LRCHIWTRQHHKWNGKRVAPNFSFFRSSKLVRATATKSANLSSNAPAARFHVASLYPLLYRLERRGWLCGRWVEQNGQRRRRYYRLTRQGRRVLASQLRGWHEFVVGINRITEAENA
jgi:DNA-binding PadR family transcriptional regulator